MAFQALACGCQGLGWWCFMTMKDDKECWDNHARLIALVRQMEPCLTGVRPEQTVSRDGPRIVRYKSSAGTLVIAVNPTAKAGDMAWQGKLPARELVRKGVTVDKSKFSFEPYGYAAWME